MPKTKLLFVIPEYSHGGTNKSLENLLNFIDKEKYDVSVFSLYEDGGRLYKDIFAPYVVKKSLIYHLFHDNKVTRKLMGILIKFSSKMNFNWLYKKEAKRLQEKYNFDTVIAFQEGTSTEFVSYMDMCNKRIAWIHFDYAMLKDKVNLRSRMTYYDKYDQLICVSKAALASMLDVQPEYKSKSTYVYNLIDADIIRNKARQIENTSFDKNVFNILSIGRFVSIKQFHMIPAIAKKVKCRTKKHFCWYIMGTGEMYDTIVDNIISNDVQDCVKIIEAKDNPYPYFRQADLHVCTSTHESFSYTIAESKILHVPVLCNDFSVAEEVVDDSTGWICNIYDMAYKISAIINNEDCCYDKKKKSVMSYSYDNETIIKQFEVIL